MRATAIAGSSWRAGLRVGLLLRKRGGVSGSACLHSPEESMLWMVITTRVLGMYWKKRAGASQNSMGTAEACRGWEDGSAFGSVRLRKCHVFLAGSCTAGRQKSGEAAPRQQAAGGRLTAPATRVRAAHLGDAPTPSNTPGRRGRSTGRPPPRCSCLQDGAWTEATATLSKKVQGFRRHACDGEWRRESGNGSATAPWPAMQRGPRGWRWVLPVPTPGALRSLPGMLAQRRRCPPP